MSEKTNENKKELTKIKVNTKALNELKNDLGDFWKKFMVIAIVVLVVSLAITIFLTVLGHKARIKCQGSKQFPHYSGLILTFIIFMWLGNLIPVFGSVLSAIGFIGTIVMIVLSKKC